LVGHCDRGKHIGEAVRSSLDGIDPGAGCHRVGPFDIECLFDLPAGIIGRLRAARCATSGGRVNLVQVGRWKPKLG
jgi:hypothetical protein